MLSTGSILKTAREEKGLTLEEIEKITSIRKKHLSAVENSDWTPFSSITYILGVVKTYGKLLSLDEEKLAAYFRREYEGETDSGFKKRLTLESFTPTTKRLLSTFLVIVFIIFGIYFAYQFNLYLASPKVAIIEPTKTEFRSDKITLVGKTDKQATVHVNGRQIFVDDEGQFETEIALIDSSNEVIIEVVGANGKKTVVKKVFTKK